MADQVGPGQVIQPRPAEIAVGQQKSTRLYDVQAHAQAGAQPDQAARILWNVRLVQRQTHPKPSNSSKVRAENAFSASSCRKTLEIRLSILPRDTQAWPGPAGML